MYKSTNYVFIWKISSFSYETNDDDDDDCDDKKKILFWIPFIFFFCCCVFHSFICCDAGNVSCQNDILHPLHTSNVFRMWHNKYTNWTKKKTIFFMWYDIYHGSYFIATFLHVMYYFEQSRTDSRRKKKRIKNFRKLNKFICYMSDIQMNAMKMNSMYYVE